MSPALTRRTFLLRCSAAGLAVPLAAVLGKATAAGSSPLRGVTVRPRSEWAQGLPSVGALASEQPEDVRLLVVHHSGSPNGYARDDVPGLLRGFHAFHTGAGKGWLDVAYNFFVDAFGTVWEGRAGSIAGPVKPDATGGNQGFSQTCCFVGDHTGEPPTAAAQRSMTLLLAALADRYGIEPDGTATFVSRGSTKWAAGASVTTATIAGHRDVSLTSCPGDAAYPLVKNAFPADAAAVLAARATRSATPTTRAPASSAAPSSRTQSPATSSAASATSRPPAAAARAVDDAVSPSTMALTAGGAVATGAAAVLVRHLRRSRGADDTEQD